MIPLAFVVMLLVASPAIVDGLADQNPGDPLYQVEMLGEQMQLAAGMTSHSELAKERINEYTYLAQKGAEDTALLSASTSQLDIAQHQKEIGYSEAVAYRDAVLGAIVESPQVSATAKSQIRTVVSGSSESGFRIGSGGIPLPPSPPIGCYWNRYELNGDLMNDIYQINDLHTISSVASGDVRPIIDPLTQEYYVSDWKQIGGDIYRLVCMRTVNVPQVCPPICGGGHGGGSMLLK